MLRFIYIIMFLCCTGASLWAQQGRWVVVDSMIDSNNSVATFGTISAPDSLHIMTIGRWGNIETFVRQSQDGGRTWRTSLRNPSILSGDTNGPVRSAIRLTDLATPTSRLSIVIGHKGSIWRSTDWGTTWNYSQVDSGTNLINISMSDSIHGLIFQFPNILWKTTNGGIDWARHEISMQEWPGGFALSRIVAITPDKWLLSTTNGNDEYYVARTVNAGKTWDFTEVRHVNDLVMLDEYKGWIVGRGPENAVDTNGVTDIIQKTTDGGETWSVVLDEYIAPNLGLRKIAFADQDHAMIIGNDIKALQTTDGGMTWHRAMNGLVSAEIVNMVDVTYPAVGWAFASIAVGKIYRYVENPAAIAPEYFPSAPRVIISPLPVTDRATLNIDMPERAFVRLVIVDMLGRVVEVVQEENLDAGNHMIPVDCSRLPSGAYHMQIISGGGSISKPFTVVR